jgi:hypothetical protein
MAFDISWKSITITLSIYLIFIILVQLLLFFRRRKTKENFESEEKAKMEEDNVEDKIEDKVEDKKPEEKAEKKSEEPAKKSEESNKKMMDDDDDEDFVDLDDEKEKKSLWQPENFELNKEVKIKRTINALDEKEKEYEENLKRQDKLVEKMKDIEKQRDKAFLNEYFESSKIDKELGDLKNKIKQLEGNLEDCKKKRERFNEQTETTATGNVVVGCKSDKDCNLFYGEGKNVCKSDNKCRCEVGSGELCQYGPTNYKDPKDMTEKERTVFKNMSNYDNFTIQDYKNWLSLYKKEYYLLSDEHLINLRKVMRGEPIRLRDIPTAGIYPPDTSQKYFAQMYDNLTNSEAIVAPINSSTTGIQVGYNYNDYSEFSPPESMVALRVINGEIERKYRRPSEKNKIYPVPLEDAIGPYQSNPNI